MKRKVAIVLAGDPNNRDFNYGRLGRDLQSSLISKGCEVSLVDSWGDGLTVLRRESEKKEICSRSLVFLSTHFVGEAFHLAKELRSDRIKIIVYSMAEHPVDLPILLFRGTHHQDVLDGVFR